MSRTFKDFSSSSLSSSSRMIASSFLGKVVALTYDLKIDYCDELWLGCLARLLLSEAITVISDCFSDCQCSLKVRLLLNAVELRLVLAVNNIH